MPQPYSADLRERVLVACERGDLPQVEIAYRFQVCPATVSNWRRQEREDGRRSPKPHSGGVPSRLDAAALEVLRQLVIEDNDALLREYRERLAERTGVTVCLAVICEAL
ncbi:helix-turn-helix domain-containing protein, partial [Microvirga tunisiensis]|uniref:helix-turn-helix domain-containing protein n=1 Tax=Microvirga tunisiensis TaxID=2108360 RepID=UPI00128E8524